MGLEAELTGSLNCGISIPRLNAQLNWINFAGLPKMNPLQAGTQAGFVMEQQLCRGQQVGHADGRHGTNLAPLLTGEQLAGRNGVQGDFHPAAVRRGIVGSGREWEWETEASVWFCWLQGVPAPCTGAQRGSEVASKHQKYIGSWHFW